MKKEKLEEIQNAIKEKLGEENSSLILDDFANLIVEVDKDNKEKEELCKLFEKYKKENEILIKANGNLLQQVTMGVESYIKFAKEFLKMNDDEKKEEKYNLSDAFNADGEFI